MTREDSQAVDILLRDMRLIQEIIKLIPACDALALFGRPALAILANVSPMPRPENFSLARARPQIRQ